MVKKNIPHENEITQDQKTITAADSAVDESTALISKLINQAEQALREYKELDQNQVDAIVQSMAYAGIDQHMELARMAIDETKMGVFEDKIIKNLYATEYVYESIRKDKTVGVIREDKEDGYFEVADPVGIIIALTPVTNPTSTTLFKSLISAKTRNPVIFSFHGKAHDCSAQAARVMRDAAVKAGAPEHCIQWLPPVPYDTVQKLMQHDSVSMILATGGASMVRAAYSAGKAALGVGPGNVPCYIHQSANLKRATADLIVSKTFDNGMICASEQAVIVDRSVSQTVKNLLVNLGCYFLNPEEVELLHQRVIDPAKGSVMPDVVGQPAYIIALKAGITVPKETKILIAPLSDVGPSVPLSREKLSPVLGWFEVNDHHEGIAVARRITEFGGLGHTAVIHCEDDKIIHDYSDQVQVGRVIVNSPSAQGAIGDIYNHFRPSLTLGCGTMGHNATTSNVSTSNLINIKRTANRVPRLKWFKVPPKIYFEPGSLRYLEGIKGKSILIVTDPSMVKLKILDKILYHLDKTNIKYTIFQDVEPDPSIETIYKGVEEANKANADIIIAVGGGSAIDAAKGIWMFYEDPESKFDMMKLKFLDIRKRAVRFPKMGKKAILIAIPTTAGTGSEITAFTVISDKKENKKYALADYELTPNIAIIDPELTYTLPKSMTADTGIDVLTHAIESYVSVLASDFTDPLALKAAELVFEYLPKVCKNLDDKKAREKMANASTIAGMAFTNAFLGLNHSMAHNLGAIFHIPHGRANALLLPHVIRYNANMPSKLNFFPQYEYPKADVRYAEIAKFLGLKFNSTEEGVQKLIEAVRTLMEEVGIPKSLKEAGIRRDDFDAALDTLANNAYADQCTITNPREPLINEIKEIFIRCYEGA
ncbi:MAG: bifunctional acetaldehyde-CoA/alcohol dehydrogenase [Alphaproteobacteria bacterium]|nr:bifunctional acetaldehyde-CoA/alcohol dehydrogenase [Alphaproteobacteria bacterium]